MLEIMRGFLWASPSELQQMTLTELRWWAEAARHHGPPLVQAQLVAPRRH